MGKQRSFRSKAVHLVSDLTTVLLNPISDKPSNKPPPSPPEDEVESERSQLESISEEGSVVSVDGPDTSSFTAFLYSLLSSSDSKDDSNMEEKERHKAVETEVSPPELENVERESGGKRSLFSRGKQSLGKAVSYAARFGGYRNQALDKKSKSDIKIDNENDHKVGGQELRSMECKEEAMSLVDLPEMSDRSQLLSENTRTALYLSLPSLAKGRKWILLYSTWRHGISLSTLYRRSQLCPGLSLLVVGDRKGAVFGGLVEAPLRPSKSRKYQGTNSTFLFTDLPGHPVIFRPTGYDHASLSQVVYADESLLVVCSHCFVKFYK
ncbi:hypothetical protein Ancab_003414 [Ancistrocladus abbreviatus]